ncbi:hypothetical protein TNCV_4227541 [Trichonephila clavipes]|nr:hypothetical protein TNCV_4227541 [Trichonephila clavipes]
MILKDCVVCLVTLKLLTKLPESTPIHLHHFLYYCDPKPQFQRQIELPIKQCPCQPTRSRQTSNLFLEELGSALNSVSVSFTSTRFDERKPDFLKQLWIVKGVTALQALSIMIKAVKIEVVVTFC